MLHKGRHIDLENTCAFQRYTEKMNLPTRPRKRTCNSGLQRKESLEIRPLRPHSNVVGQTSDFEPEASGETIMD